MKIIIPYFDINLKPWPIITKFSIKGYLPNSYHLVSNDFPIEMTASCVT